MTEIPQPCENECIMHLVDPPCAACEANYQYWADVDDSEMDIDWDEWHRFDGMTLEELSRYTEREQND